MCEFLLDHQVIPSEQHGVLSGKSVQSNLLCCRFQVSSFSISPRHFNKVPRSRLLHNLQDCGIRGNLLEWINSFLSRRTSHVKDGNAFSKSIDVMSGVPHGSVLSPLFFIIYTADLKYMITPFAMYADDDKIYDKSSNFQNLMQDLHVTLLAQRL